MAMDFYVKDGVIIKMAEEDKANRKKKGDGVMSALSLLQDIRPFKEKVDDCIEAQDLAENKAKIQKFSDLLAEMYKALISIAETGVPLMRQKDPMDSDPSPAPATNSDVKTPDLPSTPSVPAASKIG